MVTVEEGQDLISLVQEQLREEKWTRATIDNYTRKNFEALDELLDKARDAHQQGQLLMICTDHLSVSPKSIIALYLSGLVHLEQAEIMADPLYDLIGLFRDHGKSSIVEFLADKILEYGEDRFALHALQEVYEYNGQEKELYGVLERLVKVEYENAETPRRLGEYYERESDPERAVRYYKQAIRRFAQRGALNQVDELWRKLVGLSPVDIDFYNMIETEISKRDPLRTAELLMLNAEYFMQEAKYDQALDLYRRIIAYDPNIDGAKDQILRCYEDLYSTHSLFEEFLRESGLTSATDDLAECVDNFERRIAFDVGNYVYHRAWGIGEIVDVQGDNLTISFRTKKAHVMSLSMALKSLQVLPEDHLWIKKDKTPEELADNGDEGIRRTLDSFFRAYNLEGTSKQLKAELVPDVISAKDWTKWWTKARRIIKNDPSFGSNPTKKDHYFLRDKPMTLEEEAMTHFNNVKTFDQKLAVFLGYLRDAEAYEGEAFLEMAAHIVEVANKNVASLDERNVQAFLLLNRIRKDAPALFGQVQLRAEQIYGMPAADLREIYSAISDAGLKRDLLELVYENSPNWDAFFREAFHTSVSRAHDLIIQRWMADERSDSINAALQDLINNPRSNLELFGWAIKVIFGDPKLQQMLNFDLEEQVINLFKLLDFLNREIEAKKDVAFHRRIFNILHTILVKEGWVTKLIESLEDIEKASRLSRLIRGMLSFEEGIKMQLLTEISERFPDVKVEAVVERKRRRSRTG